MDIIINKNSLCKFNLPEIPDITPTLPPLCFFK